MGDEAESVTSGEGVHGVDGSRFHPDLADRGACSFFSEKRVGAWAQS